MTRAAVVWRGDEAAARAGLGSNERLRPIVDELTSKGALVELIVYRDAIAEQVRDRLLAQDAVLAWVDPLGGGEDRTVFDDLLRQIAAAGVFVTAHPDTIAAIGTKEVLYVTRALGWGGDIHRYANATELRARLPGLLATGPRVLKQRRGNGGIGVWKVALLDGGSTRVAVQHAQIRDVVSEELEFADFLRRCEGYFDGGGCLIDQAFQPRVAEGIVRVYLVADQVVGFSHQGAGDLADTPDRAARVMGLPSPKTMLPPGEPRLQGLRRLVEVEWVPEMQELLGVPTEALPLLWDCDFLLGPPTAAGADTYVLCEINASCITPFPPEAVPKVVAATLDRAAKSGRSPGADHAG